MVEVIVSKVEKKNVKPFPKLMIAVNGDVVYFISKWSGVRIVSPFCASGEYRTDWVDYNFTDYNEELTIKNK